MEKILFIVTPEYTGATTATRAFASSKARDYQALFATITPGPTSRLMIAEAVEKTTPDILFCSFSVLNPDVILEGKQRGLTVIVRSDYKLSDLSASTLESIRQSYPLADRVLVQTERLREEMNHFLAPAVVDIAVWKTKVNEQELKDKAEEISSPFPDNGKCHFLWVGRYAPIKDLTTLINAFKLVRNENEATELYLVGNKNEQIHVQGIQQVEFQDNPYPWIKNADCLILSSKSEAQPNVIREALLLETVVISSKCFIPSDDLTRGIKWFEVGDYQALAKLMKEIARGNK